MSFLKNDIGSNPGQKSYRNHLFYSLSFSQPVFVSTATVRGFMGNLEQGKTWGPEDQRNWPSELTRAWGTEISCTDIPVNKIGTFDL